MCWYSKGKCSACACAKALFFSWGLCKHFFFFVTKVTASINFSFSLCKRYWLKQGCFTDGTGSTLFPLDIKGQTNKVSSDFSFLSEWSENGNWMASIRENSRPTTAIGFGDCLRGSHGNYETLTKQGFLSSCHVRHLNDGLYLGLAFGWLTIFWTFVLVLFCHVLILSQRKATPCLCDVVCSV